MGVYDTFEEGKNSGQVKLWHLSMETYKLGDKVPAFNGLQTFSIALREGGYVNIADCVFFSLTETPAFNPVFDKWGDEFTGKNTGLADEPYFWNDYFKQEEESAP